MENRHKTLRMDANTKIQYTMIEKKLHKPFPEIFKELAQLAGKKNYDYNKADNSLMKIEYDMIISDVGNDYRMSINYIENEIKELHYFAKKKTDVRSTMPIEKIFKGMALLAGIKDYNFILSTKKTYDLGMRQEQLVSEICNNEQAYRMIAAYNDQGIYELHCFIERYNN